MVNWVIGLHGLLGKPAVQLVEEELNHAQESVTVQHHLMVKQHAWGQDQTANHAIPKTALLVSCCEKKLPILKISSILLYMKLFHN